MPSLSERLEKIPAFLAERLARYRVPGATLAVRAAGEAFETAAGVVNVDTGVEVTPDAVFQIGSITKIFTTTLVMQLVDEGRLDLDAPVQRVLPEWGLADASAARSITMRHLLTHTSGMDGDFFVETGSGDEAIERFVLACRALPQLHPPGALFSYCNAGFVIAGRIVEKLRARPWGDALRAHVLAPIGARSLHTRPEYALYHRAAIGHFRNPETGETRVAPVPMLSISNGPAGSTPFGAARDLLALARMHLAGGVAEDGTRVLSEASVRAMQEVEFELPAGSMTPAWGLGWMLNDWGGERVIGHDGGTLGQASALRIHPASGVSMALLMNGGNSAALSRRVQEEVFGALADIGPPPLPEPSGITIDAERYVGSYERLAVRQIVSAEGGTLTLRTESLQSPIEEAPQEVTLQPISESLFEFRPAGTSFRNHASFLEPDAKGRPAYLHTGGRSTPRVS